MHGQVQVLEIVAHDDVTYVYDDVTYVYDDVTYLLARTGTSP